MREVVLFIAMSLDEYIARGDGDVSWLNGQDEGVKTKDTYEAFSSTVDMVLMGWKTYDQVVNVLSPEVWPYADKKTIVFTHQKKISVDNISFTKSLRKALCFSYRDIRRYDLTLICCNIYLTGV